MSDHMCSLIVSVRNYSLSATLLTTPLIRTVLILTAAIATDCKICGVITFNGWVALSVIQNTYYYADKCIVKT